MTDSSFNPYNQTSNPTTQIDTATAFSDEATAAMEDTGLDQVGEMTEEDKEFEKRFEKFYAHQLWVWRFHF